MNIFKRTGLAISVGMSFTSLAFANPIPDDDWLSTQGNKIVDKNGNEVRLVGANWFGFNTSERTLHGLWAVNLESTLQSIADRGINVLRVPISTELLLEWRDGEFATANVNLSANPDLTGLNTLEVFDRFVQASKNVGLKLFLDMHSAEADNLGHFAPLWYTDEFTPEMFVQSWEWVTERYKNDDTIIAMDIQNEPHGEPWSSDDFAKWDDSTDDNNWKYACETASTRILAINPNLLVLCEGIASFPKDGFTWTSTNANDYYNNWWGGNLRGVKDLPINLGPNQAQLVYSPHDYGPLVAEQPWFYPGFNKDTLYNDVWRDNWMFIHEQNIAPLLIGEWGGFLDGDVNERWLVAIRDLIVENGLHHTFWAINPNSGDTGGLLEDDWTTWDEAKYAIFEPSLWKSNGKFVGLDHEVPLGSPSTGISLNELYGDTPPQPSINISSPTANTQIEVGASFTLIYALQVVNAVNVYQNGQRVASNESSGRISLSAPNSSGEFTVELRELTEQGTESGISSTVNYLAVEEQVIPSSIGIASPSNNAVFTLGETFTLSVNYDNADGYAVSFNGTEFNVFDASSTQLVAPLDEGAFTVRVSAIDETGNRLNAEDSISITVNEPSDTSDLACEIGATNVWSNGFTVDEVILTNNSANSVQSWSVNLVLPANVSFERGWKANYSNNGQTITVTNVSYNGNIGTGESVSFGFKGSYSGSFVAPTCNVN